MPASPALWLRSEARPTESRAAIVPADARKLIDAGTAVTVEESPQRVFPIEEYAAAGCRTAAPGSWVAAPDDVHVVGLKELPAEPAALRHRHIYFGHAYKGQPGAATLLRRFAAGGGALLDLEYLTDVSGRRLAAFGYWAGYVGAALAVLRLDGRLTESVRPTTRRELDDLLRSTRLNGASALVIGALGRCGRGARDALAVAGLTATAWDVDETRNIDRSALLKHDILVNAVLTTQRVAPFLTSDQVDTPGRTLRVIADVTCDVGSELHLLPIYDRLTDWDEPVRRLRPDGPELDVIAIDNLPALLPREASNAFSAELAPHLLGLNDETGPWCRALHNFHTVMREVADD